jgi:hypothetical protein
LIISAEEIDIRPSKVSLSLYLLLKMYFESFLLLSLDISKAFSLKGYLLLFLLLLDLLNRHLLNVVLHCHSFEFVLSLHELGVFNFIELVHSVFNSFTLDHVELSIEFYVHLSLIHLSLEVALILSLIELLLLSLLLRLLVKAIDIIPDNHLPQIQLLLVLLTSLRPLGSVKRIK